MASTDNPLHGSCSCGRNQYVVELPAGDIDAASIYFDCAPEHRRAHAALLSAYLRVPLGWYHSSTHAFFADETHAAIRRTYTSPRDAAARHHFCGFCGTPLAYWSEAPAAEAAFISLTLGSLARADLDRLEDLGMIPDAVADAVGDDDLGSPPRVKQTVVGVVAPPPDPPTDALPWFETLMQGSALGRRVRTRRTLHRVTDEGRYQVEWEVIEVGGDDVDEAESSPGSGKRRISQVERHEGTGEQ